jgi:hypothetical protein
MSITDAVSVKICWNPGPIMQLRSLSLLLCGLAGSAIAGCSKAPPSAPEPPKVSKADLLKQLDGEWILKSSFFASEPGRYSQNPNEGGEKILRIKDGVAEVRTGNGPWLNYATFSIGKEPQCLLCTQKDVSGQDRIIPLRYKIEGNTLTTVEDKMYPDMLPESFEMDAVASRERQRQTTTYVKADR